MNALTQIARALGGEVAGRNQVLAAGPGHSPRDRSLSVFIDPRAPTLFRVHSHAGDDWRACRDHVKARLGLTNGFPRQISSPANQSPFRGATKISHGRTQAGKLWRECDPAQGTLVEAYLASRRLCLPLECEALRFHPQCPFRLEDGRVVRLPAMVALFRDILTNAACGLHRTALKPDGSGKADIPGLGNPKKMLGRAKGAAIKLSADDEVTDGLGITEGIETALAIICAGWRPVWALGSAGAIEAFSTPHGIEALTIFADHDESGRGLMAAETCAQRWRDAGRQVHIRMPGHG